MAHGARQDFIGSRSIECAAGMVMLHPANVPHQNQFCNASKCVVINLKIPKQALANCSTESANATKFAYLLPGQSTALAARFELEIRLADNISEGTISECDVKRLRLASELPAIPRGGRSQDRVSVYAA